MSIHVFGQSDFTSIVGSRVFFHNSSIIHRSVYPAISGIRDTGCCPVKAAGITYTPISEAVANRHIHGRRKARLAIDIPNVIQRNLWLMVRVIAGTGHAFTINVISVSSIIAIAQTLIYLLLLVPLFDGQLVITLIVSLGSTRCCQRQRMTVTDTLGYINKPGICVKLTSLDISVTPCLRT